MYESVDWHKRILTIKLSNLNAEKERLEILKENIRRDEEAVDKLKAQIERAEREGKDGFDAERYMPFKKGEKG